MDRVTIVPVWGWILASIIFFALGEYFSKRFALQPSVSMALVVAGISAITMLFWLPAIFEENKLAVIGTVWSIAALAADLVLGLILFREHLDRFQWAGLIFGTVAIILLSL